MERLAHELSVLSRAVAYKNLSGASTQIGLSQPQLSRIIKRIEETLSVVLLDRGAKRNAAWTPLAFRLAEFYIKKMRAFDGELEAILGNVQTRQVKIGTLEGLSDIALQFVHELFLLSKIRLIEIDVFDLDKIEELFLSGELDIVFTSREPGRRKFPYRRDLGYQSIEKIENNPKFNVMSTFEYGTKREKLKNIEPLLISNSLSMRKAWFTKFGGVGTLPSELKRNISSKNDTEKVVVLGADTLSPVVWENIQKIKF